MGKLEMKKRILMGKSPGKLRRWIDNINMDVGQIRHQHVNQCEIDIFMAVQILGCDAV
jgi:hypothetical protein